MFKILISCLLLTNVLAEDLKITPSNFNLSVFSKDGSVELKNIKGKKILINFWASWCTSCIQEIPELLKLKESDKKSEYRFLAINAGDSVGKIKKFIKKYGFDYEILMDTSREISKNWGVTNLPVTVILDSRGKLIYQGIRPPKALP